MIIMIFDLGKNEIVVKIVYFGCAMSGKTTSLRYVFKKLGREDALQSVETCAGRTLFFDWGSIYLKKNQWNFQIDLWSATGQDFYAETRPTVLTGVDGIVFVADSQVNLIQDNKTSWNELFLMLRNTQKEIPIIIALNKRDCQNSIPLDEFRRTFKLQRSVEIYETIATKGTNVLECLQVLLAKIFRHS